MTPSNPSATGERAELPDDEQLANFMAVRIFGPAGMSQARLVQCLFDTMPNARENALKQHQEFQAALQQGADR